jgi:hypothetical protein
VVKRQLAEPRSQQTSSSMQTLPASLRCIRAACASWGGLTALGLYPTAAAAASALARMPSSWGVLASLQRSVASSTSGGGGGSSSSASRNLAWLPGTSHAAPTRSAEESFKAASQAELDVLTGLGLNQVAAEAVRKVGPEPCNRHACCKQTQLLCTASSRPCACSF